jgi:hypothetical protein
MFCDVPWRHTQSTLKVYMKRRQNKIGIGTAKLYKISPMNKKFNFYVWRVLNLENGT